jgi:hypothetical protein
MFHLLIILMPFLLLGMVITLISIIVISALAVSVGLVGGATSAVLIKDKTFKQLVIIIFAVIALLGLLTMGYFIGAARGFSIAALAAASVITFLIIGALAIMGLKISLTISKKVWRTISLIVFGLLCFASAILILVIITGAFILWVM